MIIVRAVAKLQLDDVNIFQDFFPDVFRQKPEHPPSLPMMAHKVVHLRERN